MLEFVEWSGDDAGGTSASCRARTASASCSAVSSKIGDALYLAVYDNRALENRLQRYTWDDLALQAEWVLPSLEDPAGHTYEMEPPIRLLTTPDGVVHVVGGTLHARVQHDEIVDTRLVGCIKALEAVVGTDTSVAVLCENREGRFVLSCRAEIRHSPRCSTRVASRTGSATTPRRALSDGLTPPTLASRR